MEQFLSFFIRKKYRGCVCYAHNGGKFDFVHLISVLRSNPEYEGFMIKPLRLQGAFVQVDICKDKHKWSFRDSVRLMPFKLEQIAKKFGLEVQKGSFDHSSISWQNWRELEPQWKPYSQKDVIVLYQALRKYEDYIREKHGVTLARNITLPSVSKEAFQRNHLKAPIANHKAIEAEVRASYKGARVEIFKSQITDANHYDVNSLYPYVMHKHLYPAGTPVRSSYMTIDDFGICFVTVTCPPDLEIPVLPYRKDGKLMFPSGTFSDYYCTPELRLAREKGYSITVHHGYIFPQAELFKTYIEELYAIKENSDPDSIDYTMSKLMMNSLYGKFGQKREKKQYVINPEDPMGLAECYPQMPELGLFEKEVESKSGYILPAIASFVTCYARIEMYRLLDGNDPAYCDTDSITTKASLPTGPALGQLKHEAYIAEGYYRLPKLYAVKTQSGEEKVKSKGFPKGAITFEQIKHSVLSGDNSELTFQKDVFATAMEAVRRTGNWKALIINTRSVKAEYNKRILVGSDGSKPIELHEDMPKTFEQELEV